VGRQDPEHAAIEVDDADFGNADAMVDSNLKLALLLARIEPGTSQCHF
jgi:hypothetical protein